MKNVELISGWHDEEMGGPLPFRWMERQSAAVLHINPSLPEGEIVFLSISAVDPGGQLGGPTLTVETGGRVIGHSVVGPYRWEEYAFPLPPPGIGRSSDQVELTLRVDHWLDPRDGDPRELGLAVRDIRLLRMDADRLPDTIELESTTSCNINPPCVMCYPKANPHYGSPPRPRDLDDRLLEAVRPAVEQATTLSLHGIGEPLCSTRTRRLLDELGDRPAFVQFNTNGLLLTESWARLLVERRLHRLCFSIDAARPETYRKIRHADLQKVVDNIRRLQRIKEEAGEPRPLVELNMTLMRLNIGEAEEFVQLAADLGARFVVFGLLNDTQDYATEHDGFTFRYTEQRLDEQDPEFIACMDRCRALALELGVELTINTSEVPL
jgi:pyruvate-formate lyase-activating enzyme